jgi:hypothetical protein
MQRAETIMKQRFKIGDTIICECPYKYGKTCIAKIRCLKGSDDSLLMIDGINMDADCEDIRKRKYILNCSTIDWEDESIELIGQRDETE